MRAVVVDPGTTRGWRLAQVPEPIPDPNQVVIKNQHLALNYYDVWSLRSHATGFIPGWDSAGVVVEAARNGEGPGVGTKVVGTDYAQGGWAELRTLDISELAVIPDDVDPVIAAALPVAGVSALRALRRAGSLLGRRVLITGAAGGVGHLAVQLAARGGAEVIASVGSTRRGENLPALGASRVVVGLSDLSQDIDVVIDNVGGHQLSQAFALLREGGLLLSVGAASNQPTVFAPYSTLRGTRTLCAFSKGSQVGSDLAYLVSLVQGGQLEVRIGWRGHWDRLEEAAEALLSRAVFGKAVLDL